jgi:hypothetical protein
VAVRADHVALCDLVRKSLQAGLTNDQLSDRRQLISADVVELEDTQVVLGAVEAAVIRQPSPDGRPLPGAWPPLLLARWTASPVVPSVDRATTMAIGAHNLATRELLFEPVDIHTAGNRRRDAETLAIDVVELEDGGVRLSAVRASGGV